MVKLKNAALTKERLEQRELDNFPVVYLTLISIIQGVALALLATNTFSYIKSDTLSDTRFYYLPYTGLSFLGILIVSFEYIWFTSVMRWGPRFTDTLIPFILGFSEVAPMFFFDNPKIWWVLTSVFLLVGAMGFWHTITHCELDMFGGNISAHKRTRKELVIYRATAVIGAILCLLVFILLHLKFIPIYIEWGFIITLASMMTYVVIRSERYMDDLHKDYEPLS